MLGNLLGGFIVILVGVTLIPVIANSVYSAKNYWNGSVYLKSPNVTGTSATLIDITVLFFALGVMASGVGIGVNGLKNAGLI